MLISIVFSFRNEEKNLKELIERVTNSLSELTDVNYELIFVNDDSNDGSLNILKEKMLHFPIKVINMSRRFGSGPCVIAGFEHAKGDAVVFIQGRRLDQGEGRRRNNFPDGFCDYLDGCFCYFGGFGCSFIVGFRSA